MNIRNLKKKTRAGFTLVELIVVIAILAILVGVAIPVYSGYIKKANEAADLQLLDAVNSAFNAACLENRINAKKIPNVRLEVEEVNDKYFVTGVAGASIPEYAYIKAVEYGGSGFAMLGAHTANLASDIVTALNDSFIRYFGNNASTPFKVMKSFVFDPETGTFMGVSVAIQKNDNGTQTVLTITREDGTSVTYTASNEDIQNVLSSSYGEMSSVEIIGTVGTAVDAAASVVNNPGLMEAIVNNFLGTNYLQETFGITSDDPDYAQKVSNALVIAAAKAANAMTSNEETMNNMIAELTNPESLEGFSNLDGTTLRNMVMDPDGYGLARVVMVVGMLKGYSKTAEAMAETITVDGQNMTVHEYFDTKLGDLQNATGGTNALEKIAEMVGVMANTESFQNSYITSEEGGTSQAVTDFIGMVSAFNVISQNGEEMLNGGGLVDSGYTGNTEIMSILSQFFS